MDDALAVIQALEKRLIESESQLEMAKRALKLMDNPEYVETLHAAGFEHLQDVLAHVEHLEKQICRPEDHEVLKRRAVREAK